MAIYCNNGVFFKPKEKYTPDQIETLIRNARATLTVLAWDANNFPKEVETYLSDKFRTILIHGVPEQRGRFMRILDEEINTFPENSSVRLGLVRIGREAIQFAADEVEERARVNFAEENFGNNNRLVF